MLTPFQSSPGPKAECYYRIAAVRATVQAFQSSPGPKAECYPIEALGCQPRRRVSILTRPEGRVLRDRSAHVQRGHAVSILTRPEGRVLRRSSTAWSMAWTCFNPHPARRPSATSRLRSDFLGDPEVSILTRPEGRVLLERVAFADRGRRVSILTRPEGRVLHAVALVGVVARLVSILTRPEGRVLRDADKATVDTSYWFQSSPGPKAECYIYGLGKLIQAAVFQSSPGPKAECYARVPPPMAVLHERRDVSILTRPEGRVLPLSWSAPLMVASSFQSSPGPKAECYRHQLIPHGVMRQSVSILTRPEGRVLRFAQILRRGARI